MKTDQRASILTDQQNKISGHKATAKIRLLPFLFHLDFDDHFWALSSVKAKNPDCGVKEATAYGGIYRA